MGIYLNLDKESTLYDFIIGRLTTIKARGTWTKETQRELFKQRIPNFLIDCLYWSADDTCKVTYRNTKTLVIDIFIHYRGKEKSWTETIRCDDFENFYYEPDLKILDIKRSPKYQPKKRTDVDDIRDMTKYINEYVHTYRDTFTRWTIKKQKDLLTDIENTLNIMIYLHQTWKSVNVQYLHNKKIHDTIEFKITLNPCDVADDPSIFTVIPHYEGDFYLPDLMREEAIENGK